MATEHTTEALTPSEYISHHLSFNKMGVNGNLTDQGFWVLHYDTLIMSIILGVLVMGLIWLVARKATAGVPSKGQAFVELVFGFVDDVEIRLDESTGKIHIRSASREGYGDLGANRKRIEAIRAQL